MSEMPYDWIWCQHNRIYDEDAGRLIATLPKGPLMERDAKLIAAAPEMLDALTVLVGHMRELHQDEVDNDHHGDSDPCSYCKGIEDADNAIARARGEL